jgi:uncharacterized protein (TIGR03435 family)
MLLRLLAASAVIAIVTPSIHSQTQSANAPPFEVATVKAVSAPETGDQYLINLGRIQNGRLTLANATLADCLKFAYDIVSDAQLSGPDWINSKVLRYDIVAQADPNAPRDQMLLMLQILLAERLKVTVHREQRELPFLALVPAKNGPKLHPARPDAPPPEGPHILGRIVSKRMSIPTLAMLLSRFERQTILDQTGLDGSFEIALQWDWHNDRPSPALPGTASGPSLFAALEEQLG